MKKLLILFFILNNLIFSEVIIEKSRTVPIKYAPTGITVDEEGNIYSVSSFISMVVKYDNKWKHEYSLKLKDVKIISDIFYYKDSIYILLGSGSIIIIDKDGNLKKEIDFPKGELLGELNSPNGIYVDNTGIYLCDTGNSRIVIMDLEGKNLRTFGYNTVFSEGFVSPNGISKIGKNFIIIDESTKEIKIFDTDGFYVGNVKNQEKEESYLVAPEDVFVDTENNIYVVDGGASKIEIFTADGKIKSVGEKGSSKNKFFSLKDIWVDKNYIYLADTSNKKIKILDKKTYTVIKVLGNQNKFLVFLAAFLAGVTVFFVIMKRRMKKKGEEIE